MFNFLLTCIKKKNKINSKPNIEQKNIISKENIKIIQPEINNNTTEKEHIINSHKRKNILLKDDQDIDTQSIYSKKSFGSQSTFSTQNFFDTNSKNQKIVDYVFLKIINEADNRRLIEQKVIRKLVSINSEKNIMLNIEWADQYTNYLRGENTQLNEINNQQLQLKFTNDPEKLIEDIDYVLINEVIWFLLVKLYGGGPIIIIDPTLDFLVNSIVPPVGLSNEGNFCYMNSGLQFLMSIENFALYFLKEKYKIQNVNYKFCDMICQFFNEIRVTSTIGVYHNIQMKQQIQSYFNPYQQHDCQEFILHFFNLIQDEVNPKIVVQKTSNYEEAWDNYLRQNNKSIVDTLFSSQIQSKIKCYNCNHENITYEIFINIILPIYENSQSVYDCLNIFFQEEDLKDQFNCEKCKQNNIKKKYSILKPPQALMLTFQRFQSERNLKILNLIDILPEIINLNEYLNQKIEGQLKYKIKAICQHIGLDKSSGHYIVYAQRGEQWFLFNDHKVTQINLIDNPKLEAYIILYEKID